MKRLLLALILSSLPTLALAQSQRNPCFTTTNTPTVNCIPVGTFDSAGRWAPLPVGGLATAAAPTFVEGMSAGLSFDLSGALRTSASFTPSGTQDVNLIQVSGAAIALGQGLMAASLPVTIASNQTAVPVTLTSTTITGTVAATQSGTWTVQPGNTQNTTAWLTTNVPSSVAGVATTRAKSTAAASNLVLKASAGNLYDLTITIGATSGYIMLFDATSLPSDGAVTPDYCAPVDSNGTNGRLSAAWPTPMRFGTGITAGFSTTGCTTLTASATGNFYGGYQ